MRATRAVEVQIRPAIGSLRRWSAWPHYPEPNTLVTMSSQRSALSERRARSIARFRRKGTFVDVRRVTRLTLRTFPDAE
jgi:hypothetical protein